MNIEVAKTSLMMGLSSSFQSERHIAPYVVLFILFFYHAHIDSGRGGSGVFRRSEAAVFLLGYVSWRRDMVSDGWGSGSVMRNVSKAKFDGSLLTSALLERAEQMTTVWLSMRTLRADLVRTFLITFFVDPSCNLQDRY